MSEIVMIFSTHSAAILSGCAVFGALVAIVSIIYRAIRNHTTSKARQNQLVGNHGKLEKQMVENNKQLVQSHDELKKQMVENNKQLVQSHDELKKQMVEGFGRLEMQMVENNNQLEKQMVEGQDKLEKQIVAESTKVNERITIESSQTRGEISELRKEVSHMKSEHYARFTRMQEALGYIRQDIGRIQGYLDIPSSENIVVQKLATG